MMREDFEEMARLGATEIPTELQERQGFMGICGEDGPLATPSMHFEQDDLRGCASSVLIPAFLWQSMVVGMALSYLVLVYHWFPVRWVDVDLATGAIAAISWLTWGKK